MSSSENTTPYKDALCIMLARDNHPAGFLLAKIVYWSKYGKAKIPKFKGYWIAHKCEWWAREARLSVGQYNRAISRLASWGLVEKRQWWFGRVNILYVRPTALTKDFLAVATTWEAAKEFLPDHTLQGITEIADPENPSSSKSKISNGNAGSNNPSLLKKTISNNIKHSLNLTKNKTPPHVSPASPPYVKEADSDKKKVVSGEIKNNNKNTEEEGLNNKIKLSPKTKPIPLPPSQMSSNKPPTIKEMTLAWEAAISASLGAASATGTCAAPLNTKQVGALATFNKGLKEKFKHKKTVDSLEQYALDIIAYAVIHWNEVVKGEFDAPAHPDPIFLNKIDVIQKWGQGHCQCYAWVDADEPKID